LLFGGFEREEPVTCGKGRGRGVRKEETKQYARISF